MRLCLVLGCTLFELGQRMSAQEFGLWAALYAREPFGDVRGDLQAGVVAATVANYAGRIRSDGAGAAQPGEFMPLMKQGAQPEPASEPDPVAHFKAIGRG